MPDKFDSVIRDLRRLAVNGSSLGVFGDESHLYQTNPPLSENALSKFEKAHGVHLPDDYRQFLLRAGNGGAGPYYGLFKLGEMDDGFDFGPWDDFIGDISAPFPHSNAWNDVAGKPEYTGANVEEFDSLIEAFDNHYYDPHYVNGAIPSAIWVAHVDSGSLSMGPTRETFGATIVRTTMAFTRSKHKCYSV